MLGHCYSSPRYLVVKAWILPILLYVEIIAETGAFNYQYTKFFPGVDWYSLVVPCHYTICLLLGRAMA